MMLALLVVLTVLVLAIPLVPALREWRWPSDVVPLQIDEADALDPPYLAHSFATLLAEAVRTGASHLGGSSIAHLVMDSPTAAIPLLPTEIQTGSSDRLWHIQGDAQLPAHTHFYAEVSASGQLRTAPHGIYRALWSGTTATLEPATTVLRWAHGQEVHIGHGCHATGRVTAQNTITVARGVDFMLLHAPQVRFVETDGQHPDQPPVLTAAQTAVQTAAQTAITQWPAGVVWDNQIRRAFARLPVHIDPQRSWRGDVVCLADMVLGAHCQAQGSLKARGDLYVGPGSHITGNVIAGGAIHLGAGCVVQGSVVSEVGIELDTGCTIGTPGKLATVAAPHIRIASGTTVCGTVWAAEKGETALAGADPANPADPADTASWTTLSQHGVTA